MSRSGPAAADPAVGAGGRASEPADLRLVAPALATWLGSYVGTATSGTAVAWLAGTLASAAAVTAGLSARRAHWTAAAAAGCLLAGLVVGILHVVALRLGPVDDLATEGATASVRATVTADPSRVEPTVRGLRRTEPLVLVPVRVTWLDARGQAVEVRTPVLVMARDRAWVRLLPGARVQATGRLGPARPGQAVSAVLSVRGAPSRVRATSTVQGAAGALRAGLRQASDGLPTAQRGLLPGLVVGDTSRVPPDVVDDFRTAGLTHLTAVSGANLAIVTGFVLLVGRHLGVRARALPLLAAIAMVGFVVLARPQPSVVRAAAMGAVALAAIASGRRRRSLAALAATVVALQLLDPWLSRSYGFVLSVLATGGLVLLAPGWAGAWRAGGLPLPLAQSLAVPLAAQLACAPVVAMLSGQVSLVAVPANLLVAPAIAPATVLGVLATVASSVHDPTAALLARAGGAFVWWVVVVARRAADVPWAAVDWPGSLVGGLALAVLTVTATLTARHLSRRPGQALAAGLLLVVAVAVPVSRPGWPPPGWLIAACDVGQGDALVLNAAAGRAVLVDVGPDPAAVDRCLARLGVHDVPLVVISHLHADHVEGLPGVLRRRSVGEVQVGAYDEPAEELARLRGWTAAAGIPLTRAAVGDRVRVGRVTWEVVWPDRVIQAGSVPNNASTVLLARVGGVRLLLTGDVEPEAQRALLATGRLGAVDVLKVAHHGSAYQAPELLTAVRPRIALVSVGEDNDYGHPAPATMRALRLSAAAVGRTDRDGTLVVAGRRDALRLVGAGR